MKSTIERLATRLRIGRRYFKLWPGQGSEGVLLCEANQDVRFAQIGHTPTDELPRDVELVVDPGRSEYRHVNWISITRRADTVRFRLICDYSFFNWKELINLKKFIRGMVASLKELSWLELVRLHDEDDEGCSLEIVVDVRLTGRLQDHYLSMVRALTATHAQVLARLTQALRATLLADLSLPPPAEPAPGKPFAFICHDSRDKEQVARPLARGLSAMKCPVWYDEFSLQIGDRLRESIERGLRTAGKCILVISPRFLRNKGWSKTEFDSVFTRELTERKDLLLPVWVGVTQKQVFAYSPALANRVGVNWNVGLDEVVRRLHAATMADAGDGRWHPTDNLMVAHRS